ncbi:hypothetical protein Dimus_039657 [Dionaea muscipula]
MARTKNVPSTNLTSTNDFQHPPPAAANDHENLHPDDHAEDALTPHPAAFNPPPPTAVIPDVGESSRRPAQTTTPPVTWEGVSQLMSTMMDRFWQDLQTRLPQLTPPMATVEERAPAPPERRIPTREERGKFVPNGSAPRLSPTEVQHIPHQPHQIGSHHHHRPEEHPILLEDC